MHLLLTCLSTTLAALASGQTFTEYTGSQYTLFAVDDGATFFSAVNSSNYCQSELGTDLSSFHSASDVTSYLDLAETYGYRLLPCWMGLKYDLDQQLWGWFDGTPFDYDNNGNYDFGGIELYAQYCGYFYPDGSGLWADYYCYGNDLTIEPTGGGVYVGCGCFSCNTPSTRTYLISLTLGAAGQSGTQGTIWFRIQGSITGVESVNDTWTQWFSRTGIAGPGGSTITWNQTLENVGTPVALIVLSQQANRLTMYSITVNNASYAIEDQPYGAQLDYDDGPHRDGCSYVMINFTSDSYSDYTTLYTGEGAICPFHDVLPSVEPTESPSDVSSSPSSVPTVFPSVVPSFVPTSVPSSLPSEQPSVLPTQGPSVLPSVLPSDMPVAEPSDAPSRSPTGVPIETWAPSSMPTAREEIGSNATGPNIDTNVSSSASSQLGDGSEGDTSVIVGRGHSGEGILKSIFNDTVAFWSVMVACFFVAICLLSGSIYLWVDRDVTQSPNSQYEIEFGESPEPEGIPKKRKKVRKMKKMKNIRLKSTSAMHGVMLATSPSVDTSHQQAIQMDVTPVSGNSPNTMMMAFPSIGVSDETQESARAREMLRGTSNSQVQDNLEVTEAVESTNLDDAMLEVAELGPDLPEEDQNNMDQTQQKKQVDEQVTPWVNPIDPIASEANHPIARSALDGMSVAAEDEDESLELPALGAITPGDTVNNKVEKRDGNMNDDGVTPGGILIKDIVQDFVDVNDVQSVAMSGIDMDNASEPTDSSSEEVIENIRNQVNKIASV